MRQYKAQCVTRYDEIVATARPPTSSPPASLDSWPRRCVEDAPLHRLWYDLRSQALFEESFRADVAEIDASLERMIWRIVIALRRAGRGRRSTSTPPTAYAMFDGLFQQALLRHLAGDPDAARDLRTAVAAVIGRLVPAA